MLKKKVLFLDSVHPYVKQQLEVFFDCQQDFFCTLEDLREKIVDFEGIVLRSRLTLDQKILEKAKKLEFIARSGSGLENIDTHFAAQKNIQIFSAPEGNADAVAEHVIGLLLGQLRHIPRVDQQIRSGIWEREKNRGTELKGKTFAIIGFGNVGSALAKKLQGFEMQILAHDPYKKITESFVQQVDWGKIYQEADFVSLHVPLTIETIDLIDAEKIQKFQKKIVLINTARGACAQTALLLEAIEKQKIAAACLDVFDFEEKSFEKLKQNDLLEKLKQEKKIIVSPHIGGWTFESYEKMAKILVQKILNFHKLN